MKYLLILASLASLALVACGSSADDTSDDTSDDASDRTVGTEIAEDFNSAMDKAQNVEDLLQESKENLDAALAEADEAIEEE